MRLRLIRTMLGFGIAATLLIVAGLGQPASAQPHGANSLDSSATSPVNLPGGELETAEPADSGEVVTTLPSTGIGPSDPDKRVTHWLFVLGGILVGLAHFVLAGRRLTALATANVGQQHR